MGIDIKQLFQATNPAKTLFVDNIEQDQKYYIDFAAVRGVQVIEELKDEITLWRTEEATCQLFTGHIGCGKSTELLRLKLALEAEGFHVVYFDSSEALEMGDVDISDILLSIARRVDESFAKINIEQPKTAQDVIQKVAKFLQTEIELSAEANVVGVGKVSASTEGNFTVEVGIPGVGKVTVDQKEGFSLVAPLIGQITAKAKASPDFRDKLRGYLEPRTKGILEALNQELLIPGIKRLKELGKKGLIIIIDSLDKIDNSPKPWGRTQQEYIFVDRGEQLRSLQCHVIYTLPLSLRFSNDFNTLKQRLLTEPKILPMVQVKTPTGEDYLKGIDLLKQMILARAFPEINVPQERLEKVTEIFDSLETLERLCKVSGGHVREVLRIFTDALRKQRGLPITCEVLEIVIQQYRSGQVLSIDTAEWELLRKVRQTKKVAGDEQYQKLIRSMFVYEYCPDVKSEPWFDVNPILAEATELQG